MAGTPTRLDLPESLRDRDEIDLGSEDRRTLKAHTEDLLVIPLTDGDTPRHGHSIGLYTVVSESGGVYMVNLDGHGVCDCPDMTYNHPPSGCKHLRHVGIATTETPLPGPGEPAAPYADEIDIVMARVLDRLPDIEDRDRRHLHDILAGIPGVDII